MEPGAGDLQHERADMKGKGGRRRVRRFRVQRDGKKTGRRKLEEDVSTEHVLAEEARAVFSVRRVNSPRSCSPEFFFFFL